MSLFKCKIRVYGRSETDGFPSTTKRLKKLNLLKYKTEA